MFLSLINYNQCLSGLPTSRLKTNILLSLSVYCRPQIRLQTGLKATDWLVADVMNPTAKSQKQKQQVQVALPSKSCWSFSWLPPYTQIPSAGHSHGKFFPSLLNEDNKLKRESPTLLTVSECSAASELSCTWWVLMCLSV